MKKRRVKKIGEFKKIELTVEKKLEKKRSLKDILGLALIFIVICLGTFLIAILFLLGKINLNLIKYKLSSEILPKVVNIQGFNHLPGSKNDSNTDQMVKLDPYQLVQKFNKNDSDFMLVDLRSKEVYDKEHIRTAINFPTYSSVNKHVDSIPYDINALVNELAKKGMKKYIIVYGDFSGSVATKDVVAKLTERGLSAMALSIGWNEWRHFRNLWLPESEWDSFDASRYLFVKD
jgi:rhodanese-related sulfurtransferase